MAIYGYAPDGQPQLPKSEFYDLYASGFDRRCVGSEHDPAAHRRMRALLASGFSTRALSEQEEIVNQTIDAFNTNIGNNCSEAGGINMTKWFETVAFNVLGELVFGESFGCVESGKLHFWQEMVVGHLF